MLALIPSCGFVWFIAFICFTCMTRSFARLLALFLNQRFKLLFFFSSLLLRSTRMPAMIFYLISFFLYFLVNSWTQTSSRLAIIFKIAHRCRFFHLLIFRRTFMHPVMSRVLNFWVIKNINDIHSVLIFILLFVHMAYACFMLNSF